MRAHIIQNGKVVNNVEVDNLNHPDGLLMVWAVGNSDIGWDWDGTQLINNQPVDLEAVANQVRLERVAKLTSSDWTQVADAPGDAQMWAVYRQALRDIPQQEGFPLNVVWPQQP